MTPEELIETWNRAAPWLSFDREITLALRRIVKNNPDWFNAEKVDEPLSMLYEATVMADENGYDTEIHALRAAYCLIKSDPDWLPNPEPEPQPLDVSDEGWLKRESERAQQRSSNIPAQARPRVVIDSFSTQQDLSPAVREAACHGEEPEPEPQPLDGDKAAWGTAESATADAGHRLGYAEGWDAGYSEGHAAGYREAVLRFVVGGEA